MFFFFKGGALIRGNTVFSFILFKFAISVPVEAKRLPLEGRCHIQMLVNEMKPKNDASIMDS